MKRRIFTSVAIITTLVLTMFSAQPACVHDSEADNDGTCYADAVLNADGTYTVRSYNCEEPRENGGYPPVYNCEIGADEDDDQGGNGLPQIIPGF